MVRLNVPGAVSNLKNIRMNHQGPRKGIKASLSSSLSSTLTCWYSLLSFNVAITVFLPNDLMGSFMCGIRYESSLVALLGVCS